MREEMVNRIAEVIRVEIGEECRVSAREVRNNNGLTLQAIEILKPGMSVCPAIFIDDLLERIASGAIGVSEAAREIIEANNANKDARKFSDAVSRLDKQSVLEKVSYQLINEEKNRERLCSVPHKKFLDLAVVYRVMVREDQYEAASFMVTNTNCENYGLGATELNHAARQNTEKKGFKVQTMATIIAKHTGVSEEAGELECPMWVLSNEQALNGAVVMLYSRYFDRLAESIGSDLYVLPSSIHEVIAVPVNGMNSIELKAMVRDVNSSKVRVDEVLSENVYRYSRKNGIISIA